MFDLDSVLDGRTGIEDLRISSQALAHQAGIARAANRPQLAENFLRAAELVAVPESEILEIYNALRPGRATRERLFALAARLETEYAAPRCAALVREATEL